MGFLDETIDARRLLLTRRGPRSASVASARTRERELLGGSGGSLGEGPVGGSRGSETTLPVPQRETHTVREPRVMSRGSRSACLRAMFCSQLAPVCATRGRARLERRESRRMCTPSSSHSSGGGAVALNVSVPIPGSVRARGEALRFGLGTRDRRAGRRLRGRVGCAIRRARRALGHVIAAATSRSRCVPVRCIGWRPRCDRARRSCASARLPRNGVAAGVGLFGDLAIVALSLTRI